MATHLGIQLPSTCIVWTFDGAGRILTRVADAITTTYAYHANGNKLTASDGTLTITSTYDRLRRFGPIRLGGAIVATLLVLEVLSGDAARPTAIWASSLSPCPF